MRGTQTGNRSAAGANARLNCDKMASVVAMTITVSVLRDAEELVCRPNEEDGKDRERLTQTALEQVNVNRPFRQMAAFFASTQYSHVVPQFVREPTRSDP